MDSRSDERVLRFNAEGPAGLVDRKAPGKALTLSAEQRAALARIVEAGPEPRRDGVVRWRLVDLVQWLRALGFRKLSARPRHYAQDPEAAEVFKNRPGAGGGDQGRAPRPAHRTLVLG